MVTTQNQKLLFRWVADLQYPRKAGWKVLRDTGLVVPLERLVMTQPLMGERFFYWQDFFERVVEDREFSVFGWAQCMNALIHQHSLPGFGGTIFCFPGTVWDTCSWRGRVFPALHCCTNGDWDRERWWWMDWQYECGEKFGGSIFVPSKISFLKLR